MPPFGAGRRRWQGGEWLQPEQVAARPFLHGTASLAGIASDKIIEAWERDGEHGLTTGPMKNVV
jgi:hypothetical protein